MKNLNSKKQTKLENLFYELLEDGFIYDEDENGFNMSYGEYVAIASSFQKLIEDEIRPLTFEEALDFFREEVGESDDDTLIFAGLDREEVRDWIDSFTTQEDENGNDVYIFRGHEEPPYLYEKFKEYEEFALHNPA